jgi:methyl-accepting chemotaxis protein
MNEQHPRSIGRSLHGKFAVFLVGLVTIVIIGNWGLFQQSKHILTHEVQLRGEWIARGFAYQLRPGIEQNKRPELEKVAAEMLTYDEMVYVVLFNDRHDTLVSQSIVLEQPVVLPEQVNRISCELETPVMNVCMLNTRQVYDVAVPIRTRPTGEQDAACLGIIHLGLTPHNLDQKLTRILGIFLLLNCSVALVGVAGYRIFSRTLIKPIRQMADVAARISTGDLRQTVEVTADDEIGMLQTALARILQASTEVAERLKAASNQIQIASDEILQMAEDQSEVAQKQSQSIYQISGTIEEIAVSSKTIAHNSDHVASMAEETLAAALNAEDIMEKTITGMDEIKDQVGKNSERVGHLGEKISQIGNVVKVINTIADQTRLIAFNASIEAAGAGEAGGRFSIVATEVRRLANTVVEALEDIRASVASIQSATSELILSSETGIRKTNQGMQLVNNAGSILQQIMEMLDNTTRSMKEISISTQQQQAEHGRIVEDIQDIISGSEQSVHMSGRTTEIAKALRTLASELDEAVQQFIT